MDLFGNSLEEEKEEIQDLSQAPILENREGLLPPREMSICLGHEETEKELLDLFASGKLSHGLIFCGPQGIGKSTMAFRFARFLLKGGNTMDIGEQDPIFRLVASGGHPDLFTAERPFDPVKNRHKDNVDVAEIRKVAPFLRKTASYGGYRVVIIDDADTMNRAAQNALLKILEEPPAKTLLILVTHRLGALIPTIRSRTQVIHFNPLSQKIVEELLEKGGHDNTEKLALMADGNINKAIAYAQSGAASMLDEILELYKSGIDWLKIHALAEQMGKGGDENFKIYEELTLWIFHQVARAKARGRDLPEILYDAKSTFQRMPLPQITTIAQRLEELFNKTRYSNLDNRQAVLQSFSIIAA